MKSKILIMNIAIILVSSGFAFKKQIDSNKDLVKTSTWYIAGPTVQNQE